MTDMFGHATNALNLREYQLRCIDMVDAEIAKRSIAPLIVVPTGGGKTTIAAHLIDRETKMGGASLFVAPRRELVHQASKRLRAAGIPHGVILAGEEHREVYDSPVQVASLDTLLARMVRRNTLELPRFTQVIIDEAHLAITERRNDLMDRFEGALRIGLTATPIRKDGRALGMMFDSMVQPVTVQQLIDAGYLCKPRYFSLSEPDLTRIKVTAGEFNAKQLDGVMNTSQLVGDVVQHWLEHAGGRRTVVFATSIAHSVALSERFLRMGVVAEHVDAGTPTHEREAIFQRFSSGATQVLTNCFLASYGFDLPELSCVVLARPTKSEMLYLQMIGRGLRTAPGKADCLVLDHSGCVHMHGFAEEDRQWTLDGRRNFGGTRDGGSKAKSEAAQIDCPECHAVFSRTIVCPECGYQLKPRAQDVETEDGRLVELNAKDRKPLGDPKFFQELKGFALERGHKPGFAAFKFKERYGRFPPWSWNDLPPLDATLETRQWIKSRQIAWAKSQGRAG